MTSPHLHNIEKQQHSFEDDLCYLHAHPDELSHIYAELHWMIFISWCRHLPLVIRVGALHTFIALLHFSLYPSHAPAIVRIGIWITSYTIVLSTVHIATHFSRPRYHWVQGKRHHATGTD